MYEVSTACNADGTHNYKASVAISDEFKAEECNYQYMVLFVSLPVAKHALAPGAALSPTKGSKSLVTMSLI